MIEAMEAATRFLENDLTPHGALWPGFVSISNDAEVRIAGFGLAPAVLPALRKPRVSREVAPYVAPEARDRRRALANSDVYSLGIMLLELLTGRRPALGAPLPELQAGDPFSQEIGAFLRTALAPPEERYHTISDMRRALQETMMAAPKLLYPAGLAFYLYRLLNPESTGVPPADADSTNPVETEPRLASEPDSEAEPEVVLRVLEVPARAAEGASPHEPEPFNLKPAEIAEALGDSSDASASEAFSPDLPASDFSASEAKGPQSSDPALLEAAWPRRPVRAGGTGALLILAGTVFGLALLIDTERARRVAARPAPEPPAEQISANDPGSVLPSLPPLSSEEAGPGQPVPATVQPPLAGPPSAASATAAPAGSGRMARPSPQAERREMESVRRSAEDVRFRAGMARIAAQRLEGPEIAPGRFQEANDREREGEALYRSGRYAAARGAFQEAARLYREAETLSHEERARRVKFSPAP
jgi:Protein tyrosine and serine/threonine kinase